MAMVNQIPNPAMALPYNLANVKDSRWLTLEVCREFQRNKCSRTETECKFAHPPPNVEVQNGRVTCCFDSIKGKCQRKDPPCKYLHPPQHLREQLLQNGKNNLILRNLQMQVAQFGGLQPLVPNVIPFAHHYPSPVQTAGAYNPYSHMSPAPGGPGLPATSVHAVVSSADSQPALSAQQGQILYSNPQVNAAAAKVTRPDRLEPVTGQHLPEVLKGKKRSLDEEIILGVPAGLPAGVVPCMKRPALADKCTGLPTMYQQPTATNNIATYHQAAALAAMQIPGTTFVPVSSSQPDDLWKNGYLATFPGTIAGHPSNMPRF